MPVSGAAWLLIGAAYFLVPLVATARFSLQGGTGDGLSLDAYRQVLADPQFRETLWLSFQLALETTGISMLLMVPTVYLLHVRLPRLRRAVEFLTVLPVVLPPIVLVVGLSDLYRPAPEWFVGTPKILVAAYVVLSFPYVYRSLDAGLSAIDVRTLSEAAHSLGAGWATTLWRVILPNLRSAVLSGAFLTVAIVMGEFTIASLLLFNTFPVYINLVGQSTAYPAAALAIVSFAITWAAMLLLLLVGRGRRAVVAGVR
jgi:putative spermidine/putrescine transport system permease protein